jgi:hypothetical protein
MMQLKINMEVKIRTRMRMFPRHSYRRIAKTDSNKLPVLCFVNWQFLIAVSLNTC